MGRPAECGTGAGAPRPEASRSPGAPSGGGRGGGEAGEKPGRCSSFRRRTFASPCCARAGSSDNRGPGGGRQSDNTAPAEGRAPPKGRPIPREAGPQWRKKGGPCAGRPGAVPRSEEGDPWSRTQVGCAGRARSDHTQRVGASLSVSEGPHAPGAGGDSLPPAHPVVRDGFAPGVGCRKQYGGCCVSTPPTVRRAPRPPHRTGGTGREPLQPLAAAPPDARRIRAQPYT